MKKIILVVSLLYVKTCCCQLDSNKLKKLIKVELKYEDDGNFDSAIALSQKILNIAPLYYFAANTVAGLYGKKAEYDLEIEWASKAIQIKNDFAMGYINLGNGYYGKGDIQKAIECYTKADNFDPKNPISVYSLGVIEEDKKNYEKALIYYKKSVIVDPNFQSGYYNLAATYANLHDFKNAEISIEKFLQFEPTDTGALEMQIHIKKSLQNGD